MTFSPVAVLTLIFAFAAAAHAQCRWEPMEHHRGASDTVNVSTVWDPDQSGPRQPVVVLGGAFDSFGPVLARIVTWDGATVRPLDNGLSGNIHIRALAVHQGDLYCATSSAQVLRWNGQAWISIGTASSSTITALTSYNGELIAGGWFSSISGVSASRIAAWNGSTWRPLAQGLTAAAGSAFVKSLCSYQGELIAAGRFDAAGAGPASWVAAWDGSQWRALGSGLSSTTGNENSGVTAITEFQGDLIACGAFNRAGALAVDNIARWNGESWAPMGSLTLPYTFVIHNQELFVAGYGIHKWTGSQWTLLVNSAADGLYTAASYRDEIVVAGRFRWIDSLPASNAAAFNGTAWRPLVPTGYVGFINQIWHMAAFHDQLFISGDFYGLGSALVRDAAVWDGHTWRQAGTPPVEWVSTSYATPEQLILGGYQMYFWDGATLTEGPTLPWTHLGPDVFAVLPFNDGIIASGYIGNPWSPTFRNIVFWNGTSWSTMGQGFSTPSSDVEIFNGELIACGQTEPGNPLSRWDGAAWQPYAPGFPGNAYELQVYRGDLIVAGYSLRRWDGSMWHTLAGDISGGVIYDMTVLGDDLIVLGSFTSVGGLPIGGIAAWNGETWRSLGETWPTGISGMTVMGNDLIVTGLFRQINGRPAALLARWTCETCYANCDGNTSPPILTIADFSCFLQKFAAADPYANCDQSTIPPTLNIADFACFIQRFAAGCP